MSKPEGPKGRTQLFQNLPNDITNLILQYLEPEDLIAFSSVTSAHRASINNPTFDVLWQPFLNKLRSMDSSVNITPPQGAEQTAWRYQRFIDSMAIAQKSQLNDLKHFQELINENNLTPRGANIPEEMVQKLRSFTTPVTKLKDIQERDNLLKDINEQIIRAEIEGSGRGVNLMLYSQGLTCVPVKLFKDKTLEAFWKNLQHFDIENNHVRNLPTELGMCERLEVINCPRNILRQLPASLSQCQRLESINVVFNSLVSLPESLANCPNLEFISCSLNYLTPDTIPQSLKDKMGQEFADQGNQQRAQPAPAAPEDRPPINRPA